MDFVVSNQDECVTFDAIQLVVVLLLDLGGFYPHREIRHYKYHKKVSFSFNIKHHISPLSLLVL